MTNSNLTHKFKTDSGRTVYYTTDAVKRLGSLRDKMTYIHSAPDFKANGTPVDENGKETEATDMSEVVGKKKVAAPAPPAPKVPASTKEENKNGIPGDEDDEPEVNPHKPGTKKFKDWEKAHKK